MRSLLLRRERQRRCQFQERGDGRRLGVSVKEHSQATERWPVGHSRRTPLRNETQEVRYLVVSEPGRPQRLEPEEQAA